jgi:hypothetical protein
MSLESLVQLATLNIYQWCEDPCFVSAAISKGEHQPQVPRRGKQKSLLILINDLWMVSLMLALNPSLLNREQTLINVLKALALIVPISNLHVILLT